MKNWIFWILLAGVVAGAVAGVVFHATRSHRPPPESPPAVKQPSGETINQATGAVLKALSGCMKDRPLPQCKEKPMVMFIFSAHGGGGRTLDLTLVKGWLDSDLFKCWREQVKKILVPATDQAGKVNVQYPLACDEHGKIHIRPPAWGGSISKKNLPKR